MDLHTDTTTPGDRDPVARPGVTPGPTGAGQASRDPSPRDLSFVGSAAAARFVATTITLVRALATTVLAVRLFGAAEYGFIAYGMATVDLVGSFVTGLSGATVRSVAEMRARSELWRLADLLRGVTSLLVGIGTVGGGIVIALLATKHDGDLVSRLALGAGLSMVLVSQKASNQAFAVAQGLRRVVLMEVPNLVNAMALTAVVVALWLVHDPSILLLGVGYLGATCVSLAVTWLVLRAVVPPPYRAFGLSPSRAVRYAKASAPYAAAGMATSAIANFDVLALGIFRSTAEVGTYQPSLRVVDTLMLAPSTFLVSGYLPVAVDIHTRGTRRAFFDVYVLVSKLAYVVTFPFLLVLPVVSGPLLRSLLGPHNVAAPRIIWVLLAGFFCNVALGLNSTALEAIGRGRLLGTSFLATYATMLVATLVLVPLEGALGAALATTASYLVMNVVMSTALYRATGVHPFRHDQVLVVLTSLVAAAATYSLARHQSTADGLVAALLCTAGWLALVLAAGWLRVEDVTRFLPFGNRRKRARGRP
jgi:O-antigen/teichoic acid export membrane protein